MWKRPMGEISERILCRNGRWEKLLSVFTWKRLMGEITERIYVQTADEKYC